MNKARLIWGIICFSLSIILLILDSVIPGFELVFMIEGTNMPYIPLIILGGYLIFKSWFDKRKLFGKAEES